MSIILLKIPATRSTTGNGISEGERAIAEVTAAIPQLSGSGMNHPVGELSAAQVETAVAFLQQCGRSKQTYSSYWLKHVAERWGRCNELEPFISNGALIVAAIWLGFTVQWDGRHINVWVAVSKKDVLRLDRDLDCEKMESN